MSIICTTTNERPEADVASPALRVPNVPRRPASLPLPTAQDINPPPESPDGRLAQVHFLDKTKAAALKMFQEQFPAYQEDLRFMGARAFLFYFPIAIRYAKSPPVRHDPTLATTMLALMRRRWKYEWAALLPLAPQMMAYCDGVIRRADQMIINLSLHGNLKNKYERFLRKLQRRTRCCAGWARAARASATRQAEHGRST